MKKLKRPKLKGKVRIPKRLKQVPFRKRSVEQRVVHREEVLSSARKYIYPLQHSKHRVVKISALLLILAIVGFFTYCGLALYKFQSTSTFIYGVTKVLPFPVAKAGSSWVSYNSYLFELRHYMHYYETQQKTDFKSTSGKQQLAEFKRRSLNQAITAAYVKQLASKNHVSVSSKDVSDEITLVRSQNRLGGSDQVFKDVLSEFWGWSVNDFKRELNQELLEQKVVNKADTATHDKAQAALAQLQGGADFATLAKQVSQDAATAGNGGEYGGLIDRSNRDIAPQVAHALFTLKANQTSGVIDTGFSLEIVKVLEINGDKVRAAHISFLYKDINAYVNPVASQHPAKRFIKV
jgi:hypothetical protein